MEEGAFMKITQRIKNVFQGLIMIAAGILIVLFPDKGILVIAALFTLALAGYGLSWSDPAGFWDFYHDNI